MQATQAQAAGAPASLQQDPAGVAANDTESESGDTMVLDYDEEQFVESVREARPVPLALRRAASLAAAGGRAAAAADSATAQATAPAAAADEVMVKLGGNLVRAKFTLNDPVRTILLDYAGKPGEPTYEAILHNVVITLEGTDNAKKDLRDTVVFFPDTAKGFIDLTPWVRYLTTVRPEHFSRELKKLTDQVPGRIEIQVQQPSGRFKTLVLAPASALYNFLCDRKGLEGLAARRNANAAKFLRADAADAAEFFENATNPNAASAHLQSEAPAAVVEGAPPWATGMISGVDRIEVKLPLIQQAAKEYTDCQVVAVRNELQQNTVTMKDYTDQAREETFQKVDQLEQERQKERQKDIADAERQRAKDRADARTIAHSEAQKAAEEADQRINNVENRFQNTIEELNAQNVQLMAMLENMQKQLADKSAAPGPSTPDHGLVLPPQSEMEAMMPPVAFQETFKQYIKPTRKRDLLMTRKQLFDAINKYPGLRDYEYAKQFKRINKGAWLKLHVLLHKLYPQAQLQWGMVDIDKKPQKDAQWFYTGVTWRHFPS